MNIAFKKELKTFAIFLIEAYRVCSGTLLVLFVPGVCNGRACLPIDNFNNGSTFYRGIVFVNVITLLCFLSLYGIEVRREIRLNKYLLIDNSLPTDSETVGKSLALLREDKKVKLNTLTNLYKVIGITTVVAFAINTVLSGYIIVTEYGNDKGPAMFAANTVLISGKLYDIYTIVTAEKNVYFSAYEKRHQQFNLANPVKCEPII
jgi:hypothetical protein